MIDEEFDKQLSKFCRSHNLVSLMIDEKNVHQLERLDWKNAIHDGIWVYEVEVEKAGKIGKAAGADVKETVAAAVADMNGAPKQQKPPIVQAAPTKKSWLRRLFSFLTPKQ